jgi:UDP-2,3-diacylglucosamine hydrolase
MSLPADLVVGAQVAPIAQGQAAPREPLGILAGGGSLPLEIAAWAKQQERNVHIVALRGEGDADLAGYSHTWLNWGQIGGMIAALRANGCRDLVLAGTVRRPNLWSLRPDLGLFLGLPSLLRTLEGGDDSVLRRVIVFFERKGFRVVGVGDVAPHLLASAGPLGAHAPDASHEAAMSRGLALLDALGPFDVGQAVVATADRIVAIEGAGGTDAMLGQLTGSVAQGGVLIKWPKPGQELRLDVPALGPRTVELTTRAGLAGLAVQTRGAIYLERDELRRAADAAGLFVTGLAAGHREETTAVSAVPIVSEPSWNSSGDHHYHMRTRRIPTLGERADMALGVRLVSALAAHQTGGSAIVARRYVLAVQADEPALAVIARAANLRQWGSRGSRKVGTWIWRHDIGAPNLFATTSSRTTLLGALRTARLAGLVLVTQPMPAETLTPLVDELNAAGLFLVTVEPAP